MGGCENLVEGLNIYALLNIFLSGPRKTSGAQKKWRHNIPIRTLSTSFVSVIFLSMIYSIGGLFATILGTLQ